MSWKKSKKEISILDIETSDEKLWNSQYVFHQTKKYSAELETNKIFEKNESNQILFEDSKERDPQSQDISSPVIEKILPKEFYRVDPVTLSKNLLGKIIVRRIGDRVIKSRIVETEAYGGVRDRACHGYHGKLTERTKPLFMDGGFLYVFLIYGLSYCLNITAAKEGEPTAALIRATEIVEGFDLAKQLRKVKNLSKSGKELTNGPGKASASMKVDKSLNSYDVTKGEEFYLIEGDERPFDIVVSKRINIDYAGEDKHLPWRFYIKDNRFVSCKGVALDVITSSSQISPNTAIEVEESQNEEEEPPKDIVNSNSNSISCDFLEKYKFLGTKSKHSK